MTLSSDILTQFAKVATTQEKQETTESTVYGTVITSEGQTFVKIDGSDRLTPVSSTTTNKDGDRVTVLIKNHSAVVTGNTTSPSATKESVDSTNTKIEEVHTLIADKADIAELDAEKARIDNLIAENATIKGNIDASSAKISELEAADATITGKLTAVEANIENLNVTKIDASIVESKYATIDNLDATNANIHNLEADYGDFKQLATDQLDAANANIKSLQTDKLDAAAAEITYATIDNLNAASAKITDLETTRATIEQLNAANANIESLQTEKLSVEDAKILYAEIDFANIGEAAIRQFYAASGVIKDIVISEGHVTGELVGVTIKGDLIEGGTVKADKLVIKGSDGLYYKLNTDGVTTEAEQTDENSLNGSVITAKSITATKIAVDDLVAFDATIGGFHITETSIYSGVKAYVASSDRGIYQDTDGQMAIGDSSNYLRYFKDSNDTWRLEIQAQTIRFGTNNTSVEEAISAVETTTDDIKDSVDGLTETTRQQYADITSDISGINMTVADVQKTVDTNKEDIEKRMTTVEETANGIAATVTTQTESIKKVGDDLQAYQDNISNYLTFTSEGLTISASNSTTSVQITDSQINFNDAGYTAAYISGNKLNIPDAVVGTSLRIGKFAFVPRSSGNLSLVLMDDKEVTA